ncbi:hypothetical protein BGX21_008336 [Mortierella sp. AD011]|nr:hypothetical protein BGX20_010571 [Mortierella sp. AD010]KAF9397944.1 hypothetical protein BGX21_008336 [Mortierella sp. AD011]
MSHDNASATQVEVEEDGTKVFVGNLSFQTTEAELAEVFSQPNVVKRANIITRGTRSLGYGFVAYDTPEQAQLAAETHNKSLLGGREINVEVAKRRVERTPAAPKEKTQKQPKGENKDSAENGDAAATEVKPRTGRSARNRARKTNKNKARNEGEEGTTEEAVTVLPDANGEATKDTKDAKEGAKEGSGRRKRNNRRSGRKPNGDAAAAGGEGTSSTAPVPRPVGPPSKTTVFVANLPFAMDDDGLKELFASFKVASAHVVRRRASGRSKGFGFVELVDEAEQLNVLEKMKDAKADGRDLVIKIALSEEQIPEKEGDAEKATA